MHCGQIDAQTAAVADIPEGQDGDWRVEKFTISERDEEIGRLREIEVVDMGNADVCPVCDTERPFHKYAVATDWHRPDCWLATLLKEPK